MYNELYRNFQLSKHTYWSDHLIFIGSLASFYWLWLICARALIIIIFYFQNNLNYLPIKLCLLYLIWRLILSFFCFVFVKLQLFAKKKNIIFRLHYILLNVRYKLVFYFHTQMYAFTNLLAVCFAELLYNDGAHGTKL